MTLHAVKEVVEQLNKKEQAELVHYIVDRLFATNILNETTDQLIQKIKNGGPDEDVYQRHDELLVKSVRGEMNDEENNELNELVPLFDTWAVERTKMILELAKRWGISPKETMEKLNIKPVSTVYG